MTRHPSSRPLAIALLCIPGLANAAEIDVMTQNQYLGADLTPVFAAATADPFVPAAFNEAVVGALRTIAATKPAERIKALAAIIAQRNPDVVGLQEVYEFRCDPFPGFPEMPGKGCDDPEVRPAFADHLADTAAALRGRFQEVGRVTNLKIAGVPFFLNGWWALVTVVDRDAIFARSNLAASAVTFPASTCRVSDQGCNYFTAPPPVATPLGTLAIERGYLAADVTVKGVAYRVFNTHLEQRLLAPTLPSTRLLQVGQAYELLGAALGTWDGLKKVIVTGDFNSDPADTIAVPPYPPVLPGTALPDVPPYQVFSAGGFTDAWTLRPQQDPGFSCCQAEALDNRAPAYYERIDLIFSLTPPSRVLDMRLLGHTMGDKTRPPGSAGLWPSDHASVAAKLRFD